MKKKRGLIIIMILCLALTSLAVYFIYDGYMNKREKQKENEINKKTDEEREMDEQASKLYERIKTSENNDVSVYGSEIITYENLSDVMKFTLVYDELLKLTPLKSDTAEDLEICLSNINDYNDTEFYDLFSNQCTDAIESYRIYTKETVENIFYNFFGYKNNIPKKTHKDFSCTFLEYGDKNAEYIIYDCYCGDISPYEELRQYAKYEVLNEYIYIYDYFVSVYPKEESDSNLVIYKDNGMKNEIKYINRDDFKNINLKEIGQLFKHTFKQNENGNYIWISSEPIK